LNNNKWIINFSTSFSGMPCNQYLLP
jgi:hypothetical protein